MLPSDLVSSVVGVEFLARVRTPPFCWCTLCQVGRAHILRWRNNGPGEFPVYRWCQFFLFLVAQASSVLSLHIPLYEDKWKPSHSIVWRQMEAFTFHCMKTNGSLHIPLYEDKWNCWHFWQLLHRAGCSLLAVAVSQCTEFSFQSLGVGPFEAEVLLLSLQETGRAPYHLISSAWPYWGGSECFGLLQGGLPAVLSQAHSVFKGAFGSLVWIPPWTTCCLWSWTGLPCWVLKILCFLSHRQIAGQGCQVPPTQNIYWTSFLLDCLPSLDSECSLLGFFLWVFLLEGDLPIKAKEHPLPEFVSLGCPSPWLKHKLAFTEQTTLNEVRQAAGRPVHLSLIFNVCRGRWLRLWNLQYNFVVRKFVIEVTNKDH